MAYVLILMVGAALRLAKRAVLRWCNHSFVDGPDFFPNAREFKARHSILTAPRRDKINVRLFLHSSTHYTHTTYTHTHTHMSCLEFVNVILPQASEAVRHENSKSLHTIGFIIVIERLNWYWQFLYFLACPRLHHAPPDHACCRCHLLLLLLL